MKGYITKSEEETIARAKEFASGLKSGDVILLCGDLGAGKTHFVKGLAKGLDCDQLVTSPTFTILNIYTGGRLEINHFDMYRLSDKEEAQALGFDEYFDAATMKGISVVEWPENVEGLISRPYFLVTISKRGDHERQIDIRREE